MNCGERWVSGSASKNNGLIAHSQPSPTIFSPKTPDLPSLYSARADVNSNANIFETHLLTQKTSGVGVISAVLTIERKRHSQKKIAFDRSIVRDRKWIFRSQNHFQNILMVLPHKCRSVAMLPVTFRLMSIWKYRLDCEETRALRSIIVDYETLTKMPFKNHLERHNPNE